MTVEKSEAQKWSPRDTDGGKRGSRLEKPRRASDGKKKKKKETGLSCLHLHSALGALRQWILTVIWSTGRLIGLFISLLIPAHDMYQGLWGTVRSSYRNPGPVFYLYFNQS